MLLLKDKAQGQSPSCAPWGATQGAIKRVVPDHRRGIGVVGTFVGFLLGVVVALNIESLRQFPVVDDQHRIVLARALFPVASAADMDTSETWRWW